MTKTLLKKTWASFKACPNLLLGTKSKRVRNFPAAVQRLPRENIIHHVPIMMARVPTANEHNPSEPRIDLRTC
jgi:hypothetical protein